MSLSPAHLGGSSMVLSRWSGPRPLLPRGDIRSSDPWPLPCCEVASLGVQISLETWPAFLGVCPATSWLTGPFAGMSFLLLVALHYFWSFLSWTSFPATLPAPRGGGRTYSFVRWQTALSGVSASPLGVSRPLPPHWGRPTPGPGVRGPLGWSEGAFTLSLSKGVGSVRPDPGPGLVAPPPSCLLPPA